MNFQSLSDKGRIVNIESKFAKQLLAAAILVGATTAAQAVVVPLWSWQNVAGFISYTETVPGTVAADRPDLHLVHAAHVASGESGFSEQSARLVGNAPGFGISNNLFATAAVTNGGPTFGVNIVHDNFPLLPSPGGDLTSAVLRDNCG